ncbi:hypothetical protein BYT27DRAFT_7239440 [Phlegmacium glaucopus]|nr:hypothetical protein BYT27DRAFT_7239440 [Phlegmacium glaucopus]
MFLESESEKSHCSRTLSFQQQPTNNANNSPTGSYFWATAAGTDDNNKHNDNKHNNNAHCYSPWGTGYKDNKIVFALKNLNNLIFICLHSSTNNANNSTNDANDANDHWRTFFTTSTSIINTSTAGPILSAPTAAAAASVQVIQATGVTTHDDKQTVLNEYNG